MGWWAQLPRGWRAVGIGDFFDRNVSDILFQNNSGEVAICR